MNTDPATEKASHPSQYPQMFCDLTYFNQVRSEVKAQDVDLNTVLYNDAYDDEKDRVDRAKLAELTAAYERGRKIAKNYAIKSSGRETCPYHMNKDGTKNYLPSDAPEGFLYHEVGTAGYIGAMQAYRHNYLMIKPHAKQIVN